MPPEGGASGRPRVTAGDVATFLSQGALDVLVDLFRAEPEHYGLLGDLLREEGVAVRLGAAALVETLAERDPGRRDRAASALIPLCGDPDPVRRGDAAYLLGVLRVPAARAVLEAAAADAHADVREIAREALEALDPGGSGEGNAG